MTTPNQRRTMARVEAFYETLDRGGTFSQEVKIRFLEVITGWPHDKAAKFCGVIPFDEALIHEHAQTLCFHLLARAGHCGPMEEIEALAYLTGWSKEFAEHAVELYEWDGELEHRIECDDDGKA